MALSHLKRTRSANRGCPDAKARPTTKFRKKIKIKMVYNWEGKEAECYRLYVEEKKSLDEVMEVFRAEGFNPRYVDLSCLALQNR